MNICYETNFPKNNRGGLQVVELIISEKASEELIKIKPETSPYLLLWYDTEGCGCGVNGLPTIRFTSRIHPTYKQVSNYPIDSYVEEQQEIFFAASTTLDFVNGMFRLSSPEGILNPFIPHLTGSKAPSSESKRDRRSLGGG